MNVIGDADMEVELGIWLDNKDLTILQMISKGAPSIHEMKDKILVRSPASVHNRLVKMEKEGLVTSPGFRTIRSRKITLKGLKVLRISEAIDEDSFRVKVKEIIEKEAEDEALQLSD